MSSFAALGVPKNKAVRIMELDQLGQAKVDLYNKGTAIILAAYRRRLSSKNALSDQDTKYSNEAVFDGDSVANTPIAPGSVIFTSTGIPTLIDRDFDGILRIDRTIGAVLASGTDGATSAAASRTLTSAGTNFTTAGVVAGDELVLKGSPDKGVYTVATVGTTTLVVTRNFPSGSQTSVSFAVHSVEKNCGSIDYFTGAVNFNYPASPSAASPKNKGSVLGSVSFPINLNPGDDLDVKIDGGAADTATFDAAQAEAAGDQGGSLAASASETMVVKVQGGEDQTITFGSGTEDDSVKYATLIGQQLIGGDAQSNLNSLNAMIGTLNELKADYTAHIASTTHHPVADATNVIAAADASDLATAQTLANELKADYNAHRSQATVHVNDDSGNGIAAADATNLATLVTLVAELKLDFNAHDAEVSSVEEAVTLLNEMKVDYDAHRILTGGSEHNNADTVNDVTAADATNLATAITLANDIKAQYVAHIAALSSLEEAITLLNELKIDYEAHRVLMTGTVHANFDSIDVVTAADATDLATAQTLANDLKVQYEAHRVHRGANTTGAFGGCAFTDQGSDVCRITDSSNPFSAADIGKQIVVANATSPGNDGTFVTTDAAAGWIEYTNASLVAEAFAATTAGTIADVHGAADATNTITSANATDLPTLVTLTNELRTDYEAHRVLVAGSVHGGADTTNVVSAVAVDTASIHLTDDVTNTVAAADATDRASLVTLANELRTDYEAHRVDTTSHGAADATNVVSAVAVETASIHHIDDTDNVITSMPDSVDLFSDRAGSGATIQIVSGSGSILAKLGLAVGTYTGTGDVANIDAVTFAEAKAVIEADVANSLVSLDESGGARITSDTATEDTSSIVQVTAGTGRTKFGFDTTAHDGGDTDAYQAIVGTYIKTVEIAVSERTTHRVSVRSGDPVSVYCASKDSGGSVQIRS
jgi:hypothetical protein